MRRVGYYAVTIGIVEQETFPTKEYTSLEDGSLGIAKSMHKIKENVWADLVTSKICIDKRSIKQKTKK